MPLINNFKHLHTIYIKFMKIYSLPSRIFVFEFGNIGVVISYRSISFLQIVYSIVGRGRLF